MANQGRRMAAAARLPLRRGTPTKRTRCIRPLHCLTFCAAWCTPRPVAWRSGAAAGAAPQACPQLCACATAAGLGLRH